MWEYIFFRFSILPGFTLLKKLNAEMFYISMFFGVKAACYERG